MIDLQADIPVFTADDVSTSLQHLAVQLKTHPAFTRFWDTYRAFQNDPAAQNMLSELRAFQVRGDNRAEYDRLLEQLYAQPTVEAYQVAEEALYDLFHEVNTVISEAAGIAFAANAKRSCCGG
jgi:cell fate (sporulation/competence/biofilm development) regulator YlbF (YheA/YmcA/DUF963 family)